MSKLKQKDLKLHGTLKNNETGEVTCIVGMYPNCTVVKTKNGDPECFSIYYMEPEELSAIIDKSLALSLVLLGQLDDFVEEMHPLSDAEHKEYAGMKERLRAVMDNLTQLKEAFHKEPEEYH